MVEFYIQTNNKPIYVGCGTYSFDKDDHDEDPLWCHLTLKLRTYIIQYIVTLIVLYKTTKNMAHTKQKRIPYNVREHKRIQ